jgi:hypothetical protein
MTTNVRLPAALTPAIAASPMLRDEVQVDEEIQSLEQHADGDRHRHLDEVLGNRTLGEVVHCALPRHFYLQVSTRPTLPLLLNARQPG